MAVAPDSFLMLFNQMSRDLKIYSDIFALIGLCYVGKVALSFTWSVFQGFKTHVMCKIRSPVELRTYGEWAVVTGCTDGIGEAFATELARRGINIILISRSLAKLEKLSQILEMEYGVETLFLDVDFSIGPAIYDRITLFLDKVDVGILVNNVGVISPRPMFVTEMSERSIWDHVHVNVAAVTMMTRIILPKMIAKKRGAIINMSSLSAIGPTPLLTVYSATKAYVDYFSRALREEVQGTGVVVQTLSPSYINTQMVSYSAILRNSSFLVPNAGLYVRHALPTLGFTDRTTGYWLHDIQAWMFSCLPSCTWLYAANLLNRFHRQQALAAER